MNDNSPLRSPDLGRWSGYSIEGGSEECPHDNTVEGVDPSRWQNEPPYDVCTDCGAKIY
jgi:hypothetical protein